MADQPTTEPATVPTAAGPPPIEYHVAGTGLGIVTGHARQRCAWCGTLILDAAPGTPFGFWPPFALIAVQGDHRWVALGPQQMLAGQTPPKETCTQLDPEVTR